jgi:uncharacterized protein (TIGR04255 family)
VSLSDLSLPIFYYGKTALKTVVVQLRFNPILRIGQELPAAFQEAVRGSFPKCVREEGIGLRFMVAGAPEPPVPTAPSVGNAPAVWRFKTEDELWVGGLSIDFLSLETGQYTHFSDFEKHFSVLLRSLQNVYRVEHFTRVGLRYINLFEANFSPGGWREMFNRHLLGPLADPVLGTEVKTSVQAFVLPREDSTITIQHGTDDGKYRLDLDHAVEGRVEAGTVTDRLRTFNVRLYQVFRWAITDTLHHQMEPRPRD